MNIAALVSGGVDSSVMVPILKEQGYDPHIFYIKIGLEGKDDLMDCPSEEDIEITTFIAKKYGCKFDIVDLVYLQKWLLSVPDTELKNRKAADIYNDDKLDVVDFILMKQLLIKELSM